MEELRHKRTPNSRTYKLEDGKERLEMGGGIRQCLVDGQWVNTDIRTVASPLNDATNAHGTGFTHRYPKALKPIEIDQNTGSQRIIFSEGVYICLGGNPNLQGDFTAGDTPSISKSFPNFDVKYYAKSDRVGREWLIKSAAPGNIRTFTSPIKCVGCHIENGRVVSDKDGKELAKFSPAIYYEKSNPWNPFTKDGEPKLAEVIITDTSYTVTADLTGMSLPVVIDPTLTITTPQADAFITNIVGRTDWNEGGNTTLALGKRTPPAGDANILVSFATASQTEPTYTVTSATFSVYLFVDASADVGKATSCNRVTQAWVEGTAIDAPQVGSCSWLHYANPNLWATAGGDYTTTGQATSTLPAVNNWMDFDVTTLMQYFVNNDVDFDCIVLMDQLGGANLKGFYSRENASANKPKLTVEYTVASTTTGPIKAPISGPISGPISAPIR